MTALQASTSTAPTSGPTADAHGRAQRLQVTNVLQGPAWWVEPAGAELPPTRASALAIAASVSKATVSRGTIADWLVRAPSGNLFALSGRDLQADTPIRFAEHVDAWVVWLVTWHAATSPTHWAVERRAQYAAEAWSRPGLRRRDGSCTSETRLVATRVEEEASALLFAFDVEWVPQTKASSEPDAQEILDVQGVQ